MMVRPATPRPAEDRERERVGLSFHLRSNSMTSTASNTAFLIQIQKGFDADFDEPGQAFWSQDRPSVHSSTGISSFHFIFTEM